MSEIIAKFDTKSKTLEVTKDGEKMEDIARCSFGMNYDGEYMCIMDMMKKDKENSLTETKTLYASKEIGDKLKEDIKKWAENYHKQ